MEPIKLDYNQIIEYQADRYPYLFFDRVDELVPGSYCVGYKNLTMNEWFFPIHFVNDPCMISPFLHWLGRDGRCIIGIRGPGVKPERGLNGPDRAGRASGPGAGRRKGFINSPA